MKNKILILTLLSATILSTKALAKTEGECGIGCTYTLDDNGLLTITGTGENAEIEDGTFYRDMNVQNIVIQGTIKKIGDHDWSKGAYGNTADVKSIDMSNSQIESIPSKAFNNYRNLESLKLPSTLKSIEATAFYVDGGETTKLTRIVVPESVENIGPGAFPPVNELIILGDNVNLTYNQFADLDGFYMVRTDNNSLVYCTEAMESRCAEVLGNSRKNLLKTVKKDKGYYIIDGKKYSLLPEPQRIIRRIYTTDEAVAATQNSSKNTFTIRYR